VVRDRDVSYQTAKEKEVSEFVDLTGISEIYSMPRNFVRDVLVKLPSFPAPAITLSQRVRRWRRSDVMAWPPPKPKRSTQESTHKRASA